MEFEGPVKLSAGTKTSPVVLAVPAAQVIARLAQLYAELPALPELFAPHSAAIEALAKHAKNQAKTKLRDALASLRAVFDAILAERQPLKLQQHKPVPIASYLPKFEENFSATRRNDPNRDRAQAKKFQAQYKKEFKGAMREVRKDTMFVHRQRLQDIKEKDVAYRKKIQKIVGRIGLEAGQLKQAEKMAKKGKD